MENDSRSFDEGSFDQRSQLDKTIDKIGMGPYQWTLVSLCGFGWLADNCWIQTAAIILPRVQQHFDVSDRQIGTLSSSLFFGMMLGAMGWGACSDLMGRITAFNATLFFTALFGVLAGFAPTFFSLCIVLFLLGSAVGGSMPTDGTLLLEHMPNGKQYLLTALSVFFSFGSVISALVGIYTIPRNSCVNDGSPCSPELNMGWKYMLIILGLMTLFMFIARVVLFRLYESPRYLVHAGRPQDAVVSLRKITEFNGDSLVIDLDDVEDIRIPSDPDLEIQEEISAAVSAQDASLNYSSTSTETDYTVNPPNLPSGSSPSNLNEEGETEPFLDTKHSDSIDVNTPSTVSKPIVPDCLETRLPKWISRPLNGWLYRIKMVLSGEWRRTTLLMWWIWFTIALAFTMFNVYLPKLLEARSQGDDRAQADLTATMWDIVIFTLAGCPGAIIGAYLVRTPLGRQYSLALSTFTTAAFCVLFAMVNSPGLIRLSTIGIGLSSTVGYAHIKETSGKWAHYFRQTMYAVLYGMTPEIFVTKVRGTACGTASALSRIGGMAAPLLGGILLEIDRTLPVYASAVIFIGAGLGVLLLRIQHWNRSENTIIH